MDKGSLMVICVINLFSFSSFLMSYFDEKRFFNVDQYDSLFIYILCLSNNKKGLSVLLLLRHFATLLLETLLFALHTWN